MSADGIGTFDNEDAAEWLDGFGGDGADSIKAALDTVLELEPQDYLEAAEAAHALAAAELVAAARDGDASRLPKDVLARFREHRDTIEEADLVVEARRAVARVLRNSELKDEWADSDEGEAWVESVRELAERLKG